MKLEDKCLQLGGILVAVAVVLRLLGGGLGQQIVAKLASPQVAAILLYLETGRVVRPAPTPAETLPATEPTEAPTLPQEEPPQLPVFAPEDADLVTVNSVWNADVDIRAMLNAPLSWDLTEDGPTVLIFHSHATESYTQTETYQETTAYRTLSKDHNMISIGARLATLLEEAGIEVVHDTTLYDYPSYNSSYINARASVAELLEQYPTVKLILDLHRDSMVDSSGAELSYRVDTDTGAAAQVMMVVGTDAGGRNHPNWRENMALAVKLHAMLEQNTPGICRPISLRTDRFNQDLSPGAMLIEVGAAGNTRQEALLAAEYLAQGIIDLAQGCATTDSTS